MSVCAACGGEIPAGTATCPVCGARLSDSAASSTPSPIDETTPLGPDRLPAPTPAPIPAPIPAPTSVGAPVPASPAHDRMPPQTSVSRFEPGRMLGSRYRIVSLLGRGGMGEVYRAEDLRLGETVALKFLPPELAEDAAWRQRLQDEVRVTRQVSHPNVCRVHDLVELEGETFIAMEYIDGEDLASLLRRIGRLPEDKAIDAARQICSGIAAAHARGVLHRDLKPANAMLDGRGQVKLTDFGIAALAEAAEEGEIAGTPLYMAPELLRGEAATPRSDIFSLGLVLYELLTGRRAIDADDFAGIRRWHRDGRADALGSGGDLDPAVLAVIRRCLSADPTERPESALHVSSLLPGGDPLRDAVAAGETPSPELVAAAGGAGTMARASGILLAAAIIAGIFTVAVLDRTTRLTEIVPMDLPPDVLEHRSREILREVGYPAPPLDSARGFGAREALIDAIVRDDVSPQRFDRLRDPAVGAVRFWYRQSPQRLVPAAHPGGRVDRDDPPPTVPGMALVELGAAGQLAHLAAVPDPDAAVTIPPGPSDWNAVLARTGYDASALVESKVSRFPAVPFDQLRGWRAPHPTVAGVQGQIDVAMWRGRPVHVQVTESWTTLAERKEGAIPGAWRERLDAPVRSAIFLVALFAGAWFGIANLRAGRVDRTGAFRMAGAFVALSVGAWLVRAHHLGALDAELSLLIRMLEETCFRAVFAWFLYLAIEPTVRRHWPQKLVSWTRLLRGGVRDPLVGRDLLLGLALGVAVALLGRLHFVAGAALAAAPPAPIGMEFSILESPRQAFGQILLLITETSFTALVANFILVLALLLVRRRALATAVIFAIGMVRLPHEVATELLLLDLAFRALAVGAIVIALDRSLLTLIGAFFASELLAKSVIPLDADAWYLPQGIFAALAIGGTALLVRSCACREKGAG